MAGEQQLHVVHKVGEREWISDERERDTLELGHSRTRKSKAPDVVAGKEKGCRRRQQLKMPCGFTTVLTWYFEGKFSFSFLGFYKGKILYGVISDEFSGLTPTLLPHSLISRPHHKQYGHVVRPCCFALVGPHRHTILRPHGPTLRPQARTKKSNQSYFSSCTMIFFYTFWPYPLKVTFNPGSVWNQWKGKEKNGKF